MKSIAAALLFGASYIVAAESAAAPERPGEDTEAGSAVIRPAAPRNGESAAVTALLDSVDRELAAARPGQALSLLERALRIEPQNPALWHYLALANLELGNYAQAEAMAAKSQNLSGNNRTLRARNAELTANALRAQGKPVLQANRESPRLASRSRIETRHEPAVSYVDTRDRYERQSRAEQRRVPRSVERAAQAAAGAVADVWTARGDSSAARVRPERAAPRGECWTVLPNNSARRQPPTVRCDALNGQPPRAAASGSSTQRSGARAERRSQRRYGSNGYAL